MTGKKVIKREGRYLAYSDFSVSDGRRRATDRRRRYLAVSALLPRLLSYRRQEGVTAASRHLTRHARHINRRADMRGGSGEINQRCCVR